MAGHGAYLMPDGHKPLAYALLRGAAPAADGNPRRGRQRRGKDELWAQLQQAAGHGTASDCEAAELRALARVGHRRRRRWLNDKTLHDMAGHMTAADMQAQFNPVPFGSDPPASPFLQAMSTAHAPTWDGFRNIDMDKQARVLQRWEAHNQEARRALRAAQQRQGALPAAAAAVAAWAQVGRAARAALKKANTDAVLELESQVLELVDQLIEDPEAEALLQVADGFGRLIVHGLAEFHGLQSATVPRAAAAAAASVDHHDALGSLVVVRGRPGGSSGGVGVGVVVSPAGLAGVTCTDVLGALRECRAGLTQAGMRAYLRTHVTGSQADVNSDDFVMV